MSDKNFKYQAYNQDGKLVNGSIQASTKQEVIVLLQARNLSPVNVTDAPERKLFAWGGKISRQDVIDFTEGLSTLLAADIPVDRALLMLRGVSKKEKMEYLVESLRQQIKEGKTLASGMMSFPEVFSRMYIYMVQAGEENGILPSLLPRLEQFLANEEETRNRIVSASVYPVILAVVGFMSVMLLLIFVIPKFAVVFEDSGAVLPPSTAFLLSLSGVVRQYWWLLCLLPPLIIGAYIYCNRLDALRKKKDAFILHVPVLGNLVLLQECAGFSRTIGALLHAGVPLLKALNSTRSILSNHVLRRSVEAIEEDVRSGTSLGKAFGKYSFFPAIMSPLISVGEESGRMADMFLRLGETFDNSMKKQTERLVGMLEPIMILLLGVVVGSIVIIMLSSVMSMNDIGV